MHWHETRLWRSVLSRRTRWGKLLSAPTQSTAAQRWKIKGWVGSCGPVSNVPIWKMVLSELARDGGEVIWIKVPSRITVDENNAADRLASVGLPMHGLCLYISIKRKPHCSDIWFQNFPICVKHMALPFNATPCKPSIWVAMVSGNKCHIWLRPCTHSPYYPHPRFQRTPCAPNTSVPTIFFWDLNELGTQPH